VVETAAGSASTTGPGDMVLAAAASLLVFWDNERDRETERVKSKEGRDIEVSSYGLKRNGPFLLAHF